MTTTMLQFVRTTLLGGLVVILPLGLLAVLLHSAVSTIRTLVDPVMGYLPLHLRFPVPVAVVGVLAVCFVSGLLVRTRIGTRTNRAVERHVLERIPGYTVVRTVTRRMAGVQDGVDFTAALVEIEEALVPAFVVEEHEEGYTVFVPSAPTPGVGAIFILPPARVHPVDVPFGTLVRCVTSWGVGSGALLSAMRRGERRPRPGQLDAGNADDKGGRS